ncbi:MAG: hypothetical protein P4L49_03460 [Desulfosporosinus sp.]|nr:hypothetical protein [Desulfosporosinus sp.]
MSKIKLMYDVINTMKEKEVISGIFKAEAKKDQLTIARFTNEFENNLSTGETKIKLNTELDYDGKKVKHESQTEFTMQGHHRHMHHGFMRHMQHHHSNQCDELHDDQKCGGIKGKLTKLAFVLNIFNQMKVEEKEDKSIIISLTLNEIPDEMKKAFQERMSQRIMSEHHQHQGFMKEFLTLQEPKLELNLWISKNKEVEKILVVVGGKQINDLNDSHDLNLNAELRLFS